MSLDNPAIRDVFPELAAELSALLLAEDEPELSAQVDSLRLVDRCRCGDEFCAMFYTSPRPDGAWGLGHRNVPLNPEKGDLILDVVDNRIVAVEVLYRPDLKSTLEHLMPLTPSKKLP
jgi:hypothetical protein